MPKHSIPAKTVKLGTPLDLWVRFRDTITHYTDLKGWQLLTGAGAEKQMRPRLFLVKPKKVKTKEGKSFQPGSRTFETWHRRNPDATVINQGLPDAFSVRLGRAERLDYRSDKWEGKGEWHDYTHSFGDYAPPYVYADRKKDPTGFAIVGGDMLITRHGIE